MTCHALVKIYQMDSTQLEYLIEILDTLLGDNMPMVVSSAIGVFEEICPQRMDLIHKHFRNICRKLGDYDEWGQVFVLNLFTRYAKGQFAKPEASFQLSEEEKEKLTPEQLAAEKEQMKRRLDDFYSDSHHNNNKGETTNAMLDKNDMPINHELSVDHKLLLTATLPLLQSRNSSVVLHTAILHYYLNRPYCQDQQLIAKALIKELRKLPEISYIVMTVILTMINGRPGMFDNYFKNFLIFSTDRRYIKNLKLDILYELVSEENIDMLLLDFEYYVKDPDHDFVINVIQTIGHICLKIPKVSEQCLKGLMSLVKYHIDDDNIVGECIVVIRQILQLQRGHTEIVKDLISMLVTLKSPAARASIVYMIGLFQDEVFDMVPDSLRILAKGYIDEQSCVKMQIINLSVKVLLSHKDEEIIKKLNDYIFQLANCDKDNDIRDRARFLNSLLSTESLQSRLSEILMSCKPEPLKINRTYISQYTIGSLSYFLNQPIDGFCYLPEWPEVPSDDKIRDPPEERVAGLNDDISSGDSEFYNSRSHSRSRSYSGSRSGSRHSRRSRSYSRSRSGSRSVSPRRSRSASNSRSVKSGSRSRSRSGSRSASRSRSRSHTPTSD